MTAFNDDGNLKQFQLIKFINENCDDDHILSKITIVLRRDKIEAPYYMVTKTKLSNCIDRPDNGLIHAMDMLTITRRHNLTEDKYNEIKSLIVDRDYESDLVKISKKDEQLNMVLMSKNDDEINALFKNWGELFETIDELIN